MIFVLSTRIRNSGFTLIELLVALAILSLAAGQPAAEKGKPAEEAADSAAPRGYLIRIPLPIDGNVDKTVKRKVQILLANLPQGQRAPVVVFQFQARPYEASGASEFGRSYELAQFLVSA